MRHSLRGIRFYFIATRCDRLLRGLKLTALPNDRLLPPVHAVAVVNDPLVGILAGRRSSTVSLLRENGGYDLQPQREEPVDLAVVLKTLAAILQVLLGRDLTI